MTKNIKTILLTGSPGVGKTTLIRLICEELQNLYQIPSYGFYTKEIRAEEGYRIGFDVVTLSGKHCKLARETNAIGFPKVGKYSVYITVFEELAIPTLEDLNCKGNLCVIDEIGKMELLSKKFETIVGNMMGKVPILATIPLKTHQPMQLIERLKSSEKTKIFHVTKMNRNTIQSEIIACIKEMMKR